MLILTRKSGQSITIGNNIQITILEINPKAIRVGIQAPKDIPIYRDEIYAKIQEQNRLAAETVVDAKLTELSSMISVQKNLQPDTIKLLEEKEEQREYQTEPVK